ncbi:zinc-finger homeodomain protein 5-like [Punica granatum]|uniref:Zinc-finger homeodomain protein 5-like n=1 Tax=Punica granatum TaxID=22663 RepID=A0A218W2P3_PUNGR|nr:zinc-finger homeodomain protein 5-like [Punica granatum]OWM66382.1 hypothetical protein CDL15_Pgr013599 [Punica granatum]
MGSIPNPFSLVYNNLTPEPSSSEVNRGARCTKLPDDPSPSASLSRYMECLRNHGAAIGAHILDGCGEFMPGGEEGTPESFKCAACECHRNFHRKLQSEVETGSWDFPSSLYMTNYQKYSSFNLGKNAGFAPRPLIMPSIVHHHQHPKRFPAAPLMVAFGSRAIPDAAGSSSEDDLNTDRDHTPIPSDGTGHILEGHHQQSGVKNKRFRTKFTREQKDKMADFAEKLGWKIGKQDEHELARFCAEAGVKMQVFKVWMHNSKQAMKRKLQISKD